MRRRLPLILAAAFGGLALGATLLGVLIGPRLQSPAQAVADAAPPPASPVTVAVERRTLREEVVLRGRVERQPGVPVELPAPSTEARPIVTGVPVAAGGEIAEGDVLLEVAGRPVFALRGDFAAYRDLRAGARGPDVRQLQEALDRLGYALEADGDYGPATQAAVTRFYRDRGHEPVPGLPDADDQLDAARRERDDARRAVEDADEALRDAHEQHDAAVEAGTGVEEAAAALDAAQDRYEEAQLALERAHDRAADVELAAGASFPASEVVFVAALPRPVAAVGVAVGDLLDQAAGPVVELGAAGWMLVASLPDDRRELVREGAEATAIDDVDGTTYTLRVDAVGDDAGAPNEDGGVPVRFTAEEPLPETQGRSLRVQISGRSTGGAVLAVPVTAIVSDADGTRRVTVLDDEEERDVEVETGLVIGGWVEVTPREPGALDVGDRALVGYESAVEDGPAERDDG